MSGRFCHRVNEYLMLLWWLLLGLLSWCHVLNSCQYNIFEDQALIYRFSFFNYIALTRMRGRQDTMAASWHALLLLMYLAPFCVSQTVIGADSFSSGSFGTTVKVSCPTGSEPVGGMCGKYQIDKTLYVPCSTSWKLVGGLCSKYQVVKPVCSV